uniref:Uncharacterized protein n=1 Tax=Avena sativa TaxID=4498 RepID=A0ACD5TQD5_AVESA
MDYYWVTLLVALLVAIGTHLVRRGRGGGGGGGRGGCVPPGSLGVPLIGHTLGFVRSMRANRVDQFFRDRINCYGAVSKLSLLGKPTALLAGPAANKFVFFNRSLVLGRAASLPHILGERSLLAVHGDDHRRICGALMDFLGPEMLRMYVGRIDAQVRQHLEESWAGRTAVTVHPLMKRLTFDIITALVLGSEKSAVRDALDRDLVNIFEGAMAVPVNLPFTAYRRSILGSRRARLILQGIMREKKTRLQEGKASPNDDLLSRLLSMTDEHGQQLLSNEEIVDNALATVVGAHGSLAALMTFIVRQLADDPATLAAMVEEHEEIVKNKAPGEALVWDDLSKMTFTWRVAQETLRLVPPVFGSSRIALDDIEYKGYCIPKGWQVFWVADVTHRDPGIFPDPAKFDPSRFNTRSMPACSFAAFGAGPRMCPGIDLVRIETLVTMHHLVRNFTWNLASKRNTFVRDPFPSPLHGLPIQLRQAARLC